MGERTVGVSVLERCSALAIRQTSRAVAQFYDDCLAISGLTNGQFTVLAQVALFDRGSIAALAARLCLDRSTLSRNVALMAEMGTVRLSVGERDQREQLIELTPEGIAVLHTVLPIWRRTQQDLKAALGEKAWSETLEGCRQVARVVPGRGTTRAASISVHPIRPPGLPDAELDVLRRELCFCTTLRKAARAVTRPYDASLRPLRMRLAQFHLLAAVETEKGSRNSELAGILTLDQTSVTRMLSHLKRINVVETTHGPERRRVRLTSSGVVALKEGKDLWEKAQNQIGTKLSPEGDASLKATLRQTRVACLALSENARF